MAQEKDIAYQLRTVKTVRGLEARTAAKWESQGWELVSQTTGRVSSELVIRRPKPKTPWIPLATLGGVIVVLAIILTVVNVTRGSDPAPVAETTPAPAETPRPNQPSPSVPAATPATPSPVEPSEASAVITVETSPEFAGLLGLGDYCSPEIAAFAKAHAGQTVEFDGSVAAMGSHDGAKTRYDILLAAGDYSETSSPGPAFQYRDVNTTYDLHWSGTSPDSIGVGSNLHFAAKIDRYEDSSCLLLLQPIATAGR